MTYIPSIHTNRRRLILGAAGIGLGATLPALRAFAQGGTPVAPSTSSSGTSSDRTSQIVTAANAFLDTLSDSERDTVLFDWTDTAQKQRWSNLPEGGFERAGMMWGDMSAAQQDAWLALMQATLSTEGYNRVIAEWQADDVLATEDTG